MSDTILPPEVDQLLEEILARKQVEDAAKTTARKAGVELVAERAKRRATAAPKVPAAPAEPDPSPGDGPDFPWDQPRQQIVQLIRDMRDAADLIKRTINQYQQAIAVLAGASEDLRGGAAQIEKHLQPEAADEHADSGHWVCPTHGEAERRVSRKGRTYRACPRCGDFEGRAG